MRDKGCFKKIPLSIRFCADVARIAFLTCMSSAFNILDFTSK